MGPKPRNSPRVMRTSQRAGHQGERKDILEQIRERDGPARTDRVAIGAAASAGFRDALVAAERLGRHRRDADRLEAGSGMTRPSAAERLANPSPPCSAAQTCASLDRSAAPPTPSSLPVVVLRGLLPAVCRGEELPSAARAVDLRWPQPRSTVVDWIGLSLRPSARVLGFRPTRSAGARTSEATTWMNRPSSSSYVARALTASSAATPKRTRRAPGGRAQPRPDARRRALRAPRRQARRRRVSPPAPRGSAAASGRPPSAAA